MNGGGKVEKFADLLIWGAGEMGKRILMHLGPENVVAFIDGNAQKIGKHFYGKPIISYETYKKKYKDYFMVVSPRESTNIEETLLKDSIVSYFKLCNCPPEFSEPFPRQILRQCVTSELEKEEKAVFIYGKSLYSVILNQWIKKVRGRYADIIVPHGINRVFFYLLQKNFPNMKFFTEEERIENIRKSDSKIYISDRWEIAHLQKKIGDSERIVNAFDLAEEKNKYFSPELFKLKNIHEGETCFIIGLGPSLKADDLSLLHQNHIISFSVNNIAKIYKETEWRPEYYVMTDKNAFLDPNLAHPEQRCKKNAFLSEEQEEFWKNNFSEKNIRFHWRYNLPDMEEELFSDNVAKVCGNGGTCIYMCLQIAVYMGFKNIYLLGIDLTDMSQGVKQSPTYKHFYQEEELTGRLWLDLILKGYKSARKYADTHHVHIYNATRGGYLEIFDRVDFDSLFKDRMFVSNHEFR
jgi:hypothetical protein